MKNKNKKNIGEVYILCLYLMKKNPINEYQTEEI